MTPFKVTKSFISLYVDETKLGAVTLYEGRGTESVFKKEIWSTELNLLFNVSSAR